MIQINPFKGSATPPERATFEQPLELLLSCHEKIVHFSSALCNIVTALKKEGWNENYAASVDQVRHYFNVASAEHHLDEEGHLFPAIIALDPELKTSHGMEMLTIINDMIKEHVESDALWEALDEMLAERSEDFATLETLSSQFKADMHEHARIENEQIFPYAKKHISKDDFKKMGLAIAKRRGIKPPAP
ncbi:MAG: hemerythrin domain-containing protein [gamma proteobacterium symbiont of Bathyaustriella thionipta]|nr:hemerythrin domain-containing protein [gamma proteobacterium symbiont of Bathyaustriella thionipta]MCU7949179.1 hemerythrin domain-containing protein [gamma proteobacterium symbiont of Bathyaustriella thionipta]MCU7954787.1 hemerythrin domain-containing protein [gamma proteobacterium symbiont of Bathyaustriella thionipta]MCU7956920.1 hemerythrin domain-containing protein [gamma proteobacterium symbiont of Bathyaustriella thionipta]MCU7966788.1 hemerythrin domain-containing protein [gamma pro